VDASAGKGVQAGDHNAQVNVFSGDQVRLEARAARDAYVAGRDLTVNHYHGDGGGQGTAGGGLVRVGDVPQEPPGFQPRSDLVTVLDDSGPGVSVVYAVTGMRGVGKTQLAAAYARDKMAAGWRLVAWVNAEDQAVLSGGLASVAEAANLAVQGGDPGLAVRHWLEAGGEQCLVVFDNGADPDLLRPYLPAAGAARVVVTSSRASMAELGHPVGVDVFTPDEAAAFLTDRTGLSDPLEAGKLAEELGFLPLGLAQAAAVISGQRLGYATYLKRLRELPVASFLTRQDGQPYPRGVAETVLLSLQAVKAGDQAGACTGVMALLSVLSAAGVRRDLLHTAMQYGALTGGHGLDAPVVDEALGRLAEYSLLAFSVDGQGVLAHRLVMRVVRERLAVDDTLPAVLREAVRMLAGVAGTLSDDAWRDPDGVRELAGQVVALVACRIAYPNAFGGETLAALLWLRLRSVYLLNGLEDSAGLAIEAAKPLAADCERLLGADHEDTLAAYSLLASAYVSAGQAAEAIPLFERVLGARQRQLGTDHHDTLGARNNLATAYQVAGRTTEAIPLLERTLADSERIQGTDHPDTLTSRNNLAQVYQATGRTTQAILLLERTLADCERIEGADHPDTLGTRNNLATTYIAAGRTSEAIRLLEQTLAACERLLSPDHPSTFSTRSNLALAYQGAGRTAEAIPLLERTLADRERLQSTEHPDTLGARTNLAAAYRVAGRPAKAIPLLVRTLEDFERLLGADHPGTLTTRNNLGTAYQAAGRSTEAIPLLVRSLGDFERLLGADHPSTLASRNNLGMAYRVAGRTTEAIPLLEQTVADRERTLGIDHPDALASRNNLAQAYGAAGRSPEASSLLKRTLRDCERLLGADHPTTKVVRRNLAALNGRSAPRRKRTRG
jgi:tetratricopeptide (TPR) repeat protein